MNKNTREKCDVCSMYPKETKSDLCKSCNGVRNNWINSARKMNISLAKYLLRTSKF